MITIDQFQDMLADSMFAGNGAVAGVVIFAVVMAVIFMLMKRNVFGSLAMTIPVAFVFTLLGILSVDLAMILIVICVLGLAMTAKRTIGERSCSWASPTSLSSSRPSSSP